MEGLIAEISNRSSKRALSDKKIADDVVQRLMSAATLAPSCFNNQSWRFMVASDAAALAKVHEALSSANYWARTAPMIVVVATKPSFGCQLDDNREYALFDCGLATENLMLQAVKEGLHAHAMAGFDPVKIKTSFHIPEDYIVITLVAVGYPGDAGSLNETHRGLENAPRNRKPREAVIAFNGWDFSD